MIIAPSLSSSHVKFAPEIKIPPQRNLGPPELKNNYRGQKAEVALQLLQILLTV